MPRKGDLTDHHSRILVHDGISWRIWPSVIENLDECRPPKVVTDLGPGRFFFHAQNGEFFAMPYPDASWATLQHIPESELHAWLSTMRSR